MMSLPSPFVTFFQAFLIVACLTSRAFGAPYNDSDVYISPFPQISDPPPGGFLLWSAPSTWPNGAVPGVGANLLANATILPGVAVLLDVALVTLHTLRIQGFLKFKDDPLLPTVRVVAHYVVVEGQLSIGTASAQYSQKAIIELSPNLENNRNGLTFTSFAPADPLNPRALGHKAFATVGGQLHLHGLPGPSTMPVWCRLIANALYNTTTITVDDVGAASWPVGSTIVISSTDYDYDQAEQVVITKVVKGTNSVNLTFSQPLKYMHWGNPGSLPDGFGGFVDQRAEVALLSRNILITGTEELYPYEYHGGHFIVYMTPVVQYIEGVEFWMLGQQGTLGRYSMHFHINGVTPNTVVRKNSIHRSYQRCVVIHACNNMTIDSNVAYNTSGHCFLTEEGGEVNNMFINNLGMKTVPVVKPIFLANQPTVSVETDITPSTFWNSNANNHWVNNVAAGSKSSGFWIELRGAVRGNSLNVPSLASIIPTFSLMGKISGNTAHSNGDVGFRTYPHGFRPRIPQQWGGTTVPAVITALSIYKNANIGVFIHDTDSLTITNSTFADNGFALSMPNAPGMALSKSRMVALTPNLGNPTQCTYQWPGEWTPCRNVNGCGYPTLPLPAGTPGRSTGAYRNTAPTFGVSIFQIAYNDDGHLPQAVQTTTFSGYNSTCHLASALLLTGQMATLMDAWNPTSNVSGLKFVGSQPIYVAHQIDYTQIWTPPENGGEQSKFYTLRDLDGSIVGGTGGYVVANTSFLLPPNLVGCKAQTSWNAYACQGVCYRAVQLFYNEPGFGAAAQAAYNAAVPLAALTYSYIIVRRSSDGQTLVLTGNLNPSELLFTTVDDMRYFSFTALANNTYTITFVSGSVNPSFIPSSFGARYQDASGCGQGLDLQLVLPPYLATMPSWVPQRSANVSPKLCPGATSTQVSVTAQTSVDCVNNTALVHIALGVNFGQSVIVVPSNASTACPTTLSCGTLWTYSPGWTYNPSGYFLGPSLWDPIANQTGFIPGVAPFGYTSWGYQFPTNLPAPSVKQLSYGFRTTFSLSNTACITSFTLNTMVTDGMVVYLNGRQLIAINMPPVYPWSPLTNATVAISMGSYNTFQAFTFSHPGYNNSYNLKEGINYLAVDLHTYGQWAWQLSFDADIAVTYSSPTCKGAMIAPEICDGVDNNNDGFVDSVAGVALTMPCQTACGSGIITCAAGLFKQDLCSARAPTPEVCDGLDNNCDGMIDNGPPGLNCAVGSVCFLGKCTPITNATTLTQVWPRNTTGWAYWDMGGDMNALNPTWKVGSNLTRWKTGQASFGFDSWDTWPAPFASTPMNMFTGDGKSLTAYFSKNFTLTQTQLTSAFSVALSLRRVEGAIVYLNGVEVTRSGMPNGPVAFNTTANTIGGGATLATYYPCTGCMHNTSSLLQVGANWVSAEVHAAWFWESRMAFDLDLYLNTLVSCSSLPGSPATCVRQVAQNIILPNSIWSYSDFTLPAPGAAWTSPSYNTTSWPKGPAPLGIGSAWLMRTNLTMGPDPLVATTVTSYFSKSLTVVDGACYVQINMNVLMNDCGIIYINGAEAYRFGMPAGYFNATTFCPGGGDWTYHTIPLSGGWLKSGVNVIDVELHRAPWNTQYVFFDLQMSGFREATNCLPAAF
eukprot:TRINITY_DN35570_c0_g1_i1.p1 TRINITY_DN35570_c0_g1~~TRINITY_DN35570_c0_g1_i1.p1  ORF type:complete len:1629 (-),score=236.92 TRINITY_DN35570_c0_g1_i1:1352-6238(-)